MRSMIPVALDGTVRSIRIEDEHPGTRNVYFVRIDSTTRQMDPATGRLLAVGDRVSKDAWSRELRVDDRTVRLGLSREAKASLWFAPLLVGIAAVVPWVPGTCRSAKPKAGTAVKSAARPRPRGDRI